MSAVGGEADMRFCAAYVCFLTLSGHWCLRCTGPLSGLKRVVQGGGGVEAAVRRWRVIIPTRKRR